MPDGIEVDDKLKRDAADPSRWGQPVKVARRDRATGAKDHVWICYWGDEQLKDVVWCRDCGVHKVEADGMCLPALYGARATALRAVAAILDEAVLQIDRAVATAFDGEQVDL